MPGTGHRPRIPNVIIVPEQLIRYYPQIQSPARTTRQGPHPHPHVASSTWPVRIGHRHLAKHHGFPRAVLRFSIRDSPGPGVPPSINRRAVQCALPAWPVESNVQYLVTRPSRSSRGSEVYRWASRVRSRRDRRTTGDRRLPPEVRPNRRPERRRLHRIGLNPTPPR